MTLDKYPTGLLAITIPFFMTLGDYTTLFHDPSSNARMVHCFKGILVTILTGADWMEPL